ncbi:diguanylate cyclase [Kutzneria sp. 744]|uniref:GGDEF domain-containing protein n=1 Tax=Kutzneria sp. (strain 744) TaxID=345341 RepID=UPI0003EEC372|nr:diguanylate cyclase [Kutzneria sp. 744]EWM14891.1 diguanylate cyclase [Kutzneria sp. 744]
MTNGLVVRDWSMWTLPRPALVYWIAVDLAALVVGGCVLAATAPPTLEDLGRFGAIAGTGLVVVVITAIATQLSNETRRNPWALHICYLSAGLLVLPPNLTLLLLLGPALYGVLGPGPEAHRWLFTLAATTLSVFAARAALGWTRPSWDFGMLVLGGIVLLMTRAVLVAVGLRLRAPSAGSDEVFGEPIDVVLGIVAVSTGALMAVSVLTDPIRALLAGPPMFLLERAAQLPQWRRSAQRDAKTGLSNAVHWDLQARDELAKASSRQRPVAMMLLDLDHFKRVNDRVGHLAGDAALAAVARELRVSVRHGDVVGRFGGEEFVVLLPDTGPGVAESVAERVRHAISLLRVATTAADGHAHVLSGLTVSIGVSTSDRYGYDVSTLLVAADSALLSAKGYGRNLVAMA